MQTVYDSTKEWRGDAIRDVVTNTSVSVETFIDDYGNRTIKIVNDGVLVASLSGYHAKLIAYHIDRASDAVEDTNEVEG